MIGDAFIVMLTTQVFKWLSKRFDLETSRFLIHAFLFTFSVCYAIVKMGGSITHLDQLRPFFQILAEIWVMASGTYEVLKTLVSPVVGRIKPFIQPIARIVWRKRS
jgi:hypothetical protein